MSATVTVAEYTREEIIGGLANYGLTVTARQLRSWAAYGWIPHPARHGVGPGTKARAIYTHDDFKAIRAVAETRQKPPTRAALLAELRSWEGDGDPEIAHREADLALLRYIGDDEITAAFEAITRWYV